MRYAKSEGLACKIRDSQKAWDNPPAGKLNKGHTHQVPCNGF